MNSKTVDMDCGLSLRVLMTKHNISREKMANELGVSNTTVSILRRDKYISGKNIKMLSEYFGISASDFIKIGEDID